MFTRTSRTLFPVLVLSLFVVFAGCSDDETTTPVAGDMGQGAMIRVVHASPNAPAVDIYAEGVASPLWTNAGYGATTAYRSIEAGTYNIQLRGAGAGAGTTPVFETGDITVPDGATITAIAAGNYTSTDAADRFRILLAVENFAAPGAGNAAVRVIHASPDAPTVGIDVGDDSAVDVENFVRFGDTGEAGVPLPSGQELQIAILAGATRVTGFTTPQLPDGAKLFVIATGFLGQLPRETDGFSLLAVGPAGTIGFIKQNPVVFALHGSPDAPPVDIYAGSARLVENLSFGQLSDPVQVPPAAYTLSFRGTGSVVEAASVTTPALAAGERYLAVASGFLGDNSFTLVPVAESFGDASTGALVRVVHASSDAPIVDIGTVSGGVVSPVPDYTGLGFEESSKSEGTALPSATLDIGVAGSGTTSAVAEFTVTTSPGLKAFAVAAGSFADPTAEAFRLLVVNATDFPWSVAEVLPNP